MDGMKLTKTVTANSDAEFEALCRIFKDEGFFGSAPFGDGRVIVERFHPDGFLMGYSAFFRKGDEWWRIHLPTSEPAAAPCP